MGSKGDCFDNAVIESFWATLKKEIGLTTGRKFATRAEAHAAIFEYIETFYNPRRRHSTLAYRSPIEHERLHTARALTPAA
jgi:transposase InsO family protein